MKRLFIYFLSVLVITFLIRTFLIANEIESLENRFKSAFSDLSKIGYKLQHQAHKDEMIKKSESFFRNPQKIRIDWHDYKYIDAEKKQVGIGEGGVPVKLPVEDEPEQTRLVKKIGFNALLSDRIALNRSIPDLRHKE